jgi:competence protein ComEC
MSSTVTQPGQPVPGAAANVRRYEPLAPAALAFIIGIVVAEYAGGGMLAWCAVAVAAAAFWVALYLRGAGAAWLLAPLLVLVGAAGAARYRASVDPAPDDIARFAESGRRLVRVEGVVVRSARQTSPPDDVFLPAVPYYVRNTLTLECRRILVEGRWHPAGGRVAVTVRQAQPADASGVPNLGDAVQVTGILAPFGRPANPGAFDMGAYLRRQGIRASVITDHWEAVRVVEPRADLARWLVGRMQRFAVASLDRLPTPEGRAITGAMVFGRRDLLDFDSGQVHGRDIERAFLATGTTHLLAVSGFNVGLLAAAVLLVVRMAGFGPRTTALIVAGAVAAFTLMTELEPPVLRAAILFGVVCLGWLAGRAVVALNTLAAAVLVVLLVRPGDLFTTSFQLSFLAVLGMMFLVDRLEDVLRARRKEAERLRQPGGRPGWWYRRVLRGALMVSVAATVINIPLIAYRFHLVAWLAPVATTVLVPLAFGLTVAGMMLVGLGWLHPWIYAVLAAGTDALGRATTAVVEAMAHVPGAYCYVGSVTLGWLVVAYVLLTAFAWRRRLGISRRHLAMASLAAAAVFVWTGGHSAPPCTRATFFAVGSGLTTLVELPNGRNVLYDVGSSLSQAKAAEATLAPALWALRVDRVDAVFLSHAHFDHFKDILPLVERFGIRQVFVPPTFLRKRLQGDDKVVEALLARGVRVEFFGAGDRLAGTGSVEVAAVWPRGSISQTRAINNGSLVLAIGDGGRRLLLAGDIEPSGLAGLLEAEPGLRADAMLWPHHGHAPEAVGRFAAATGARALVISASPTFAPRDPPAWLKEHRMACFDTGEVGAVAIELRPEGVQASALGGTALPETPALAEDDGDKEGLPD